MLYSDLAAHSLKINTWEGVNGGKESWFWSEYLQSREMVDSVSPQSHLQRFCSAMTALKGKGGVISLIIKIRGQSHCHAPLYAGLSTSCDLSLELSVHIVCLQDYWGGTRKEIWSSVNYFFLSTLIYRKNQQVRQGVRWSKNMKNILGPEMNRAWQGWGWGVK